MDGVIEIINLHDGNILVINEEGEWKYGVNETATQIAKEHLAIFPWDVVVGDVVLCKDEEVQ